MGNFNEDVLANLKIDRCVVYKDVEYRIVDILNSDNLLVVNKEDYENEKFPLLTYIIPGQ